MLESSESQGGGVSARRRDLPSSPSALPLAASESLQAGSALPNAGGLSYLATVAGVFAHTQLHRSRDGRTALFPAIQEKDAEREGEWQEDDDEDEEDSGLVEKVV